MSDYRRAYVQLTPSTKAKRLKYLKSIGLTARDYKTLKDPNGYWEIWLKGGK